MDEDTRQELRRLGQEWRDQGLSNSEILTKMRGHRARAGTQNALARSTESDIAPIDEPRTFLEAMVQTHVRIGERQDFTRPYNSMRGDPDEDGITGSPWRDLQHNIGDLHNELAPIGGWKKFFDRAAKGRSTKEDQAWLTEDRRGIVHQALCELVNASVEKNTFEIFRAR